MKTEDSVTTASGHEIAYRITGDPSKPAIMFLNGSIFNYLQFDAAYLPKLQKYLGDRYVYYQYDYVGYGLSSDLEGEFDFLTIAEQHVEFMDAMGLDNAHLFGLSKGSIIAQLVTAKYPERVLSLAGYGSPNLAEEESREQSARIFGDRLDAVKSLAGIYNEPVTEKNFELIYDTVYVPSIFDKQLFQLGLFEKIRNKFIKWRLKPMMMGPKVEILDKLFSYYKKGISEEEKERYIEAMKNIEVPTLLIHGTADETVPMSSSKLLAEWIPNCQLQLIDGYKHSNPTLLPWQGAKVMKQYAKFINNLEEQ